MGHDLTLQAIKVPSLLLERLHAGAFDPELLVFVAYYFDGRRKRGVMWSDFLERDPESEPFVESLEQMLAEDPAIDLRCCHLNRQYSWLHMTLEAVANCEFATWAVLGQEQILPNATSTQGFRIMWNGPETCKNVSAWLADINESELLAAFSIETLQQRRSYKIEQNPEADFVLESVIDSFRRLKGFYQTVVHHQNGVLFDKD